MLSTVFRTRLEAPLILLGSHDVLVPGLSGCSRCRMAYLRGASPWLVAPCARSRTIAERLHQCRRRDEENLASVSLLARCLHYDADSHAETFLGDNRDGVKVI